MATDYFTHSLIPFQLIWILLTTTLINATNPHLCENPHLCYKDYRSTSARYKETKYDCPGTDAGYQCDYKAEWSSRNGDHFFCDADVINIHDLTKEKFVNEYMFKKPLLIDANLSDWSDPEFWSKASMLSNYGEYPFEAGRSLELVLNAGVGEMNVTLNDYFMDSMQLKDSDNEVFTEPLYVFDRSIWREEDEFQLKHFHAPSYLINTMETQYGIFFIGVSGTGATWHAHGENWAGIAYGRKRWFLYPPEVSPVGGSPPGYSAKDWYLNLYPHLTNKLDGIDALDWGNFQFNTSSPDTFIRSDILNRQTRGSNGNFMSLNSDSKISDILSPDFNADNGNDNGNNGLYAPIECIQKEGQLIYLPEYWWHSVLNLGDVVAAGIQSSESYSAWMLEADLLGDLDSYLYDNKRRKKHLNVFTDLEKDAIHYDILKLHERKAVFAPFNDVSAYFQGIEWMELNDDELAEEYLQDSLLMDPSNIQSYLNLANLYNTDDVWDRYLMERCLRIAYVLNPNNPDVRNRLIHVFESQISEDNDDSKNDFMSGLMGLAEKRLPLPPIEVLTREQVIESAERERQERENNRQKA